MFPFCRPFLPVSKWARNVMRYPNTLEEGVKLMILSSPICLDGLDLSIKQSFNKILEITKALENFGLMLDQVDPCELAKIINKGYIIFESVI
jgi:hypothetical protein